ncbi:DUF4350 domain-containing protein [Rufibacter ruber]|uniref:DUF4350 domain-containing protein n=1 Tax=Rufibacter ruber TaxID=1783499 RepID=UPI000836E4F3|nr:DUF4350 domain-containing protein [Rufibacter ruber]
MSGMKKWALVLALLFTVFVVVEYYRPKPVEWAQTYVNKDKIPYGTYVLYQLLPDLFPSHAVEQVRLPILNQLENYWAAEEDSAAGTVNYLFVNASFQADSLDLDALLGFVEAGNNVFIGSHYFGKLQDTLHFKVEAFSAQKKDSLGLVFTHPQFKDIPPVLYDWEKVDGVLELGSAAQATVLGKNTEGGVNYVQMPFGKGNFFLSTVPLAFTNYHVITNRQNRYAAMALSHLPDQTVWWDEYQKQGPEGESSIFRVLLSHDALAWAYYVALGGLLVFVFFESKRTQRIIPVWEKPRNTTLEFVRVVGNLYFNHGDHKVIAEKKVNYFLEYLRLHYHESTSVLDAEFQERISHKSGVDAQEVSKLFYIIQDVRTYETVQEVTLWQLNQKLENFYRQASR